MSAPVQLGRPMTISCNGNRVSFHESCENFRWYNFDCRHLGCVSLSRLLQSEQKYSLLQLNLKMAELGKSSIILFSSFADTNRMSERAAGDPRICELLVSKLESKDLGSWRSNFSKQEIYNMISFQVCCQMQVQHFKRKTFQSVGNTTSARESSECSWDCWE